MATPAHCLACFEALDAHLSRRPPLPLSAIVSSYAKWKSSSPSPTSGPSSPLFVTWNTVRPSHSLRGCIGTFEPEPLDTGLPEYALTSALHDTRFSPITSRELPSLEAAVTLLTDFEPAQDPHDWDLGKHGIRLAFVDPASGRRLGATYLPDVAVEQGWDKDETLRSLVRKAGYSRGKWTDLDLKVTRYQGKKASLDYEEFKKWRDWLAAEAE